ncbi:MAG: type II secretion system protein GspN [Deltaproteobacteria bacterium]|nr:type II secretion system protein GspN [Deltaproteobacteria bacterium]MBI3293831.1 type II secretion system protein GspN [Deltaproteobacteria bacterium]
MQKPKASTILMGIGIFFVFLMIRFPLQNLKGMIFGQIYKASGIYIIADDIYPSIFGWPGIGMRNVSITAPFGSTEVDLECRKLIARAGIAGLFPPTPSFSLYMKELKKGGDLYVRFSQSKTGMKAAIEASQLNLVQLSPSGPNPFATGTVDLDSDISLNTSNPSLTTGEATITFKDLTLGAQNLQGIVLSEMKLGNVKGETNIKGGVASIATFVIGDAKSDLQGNLSGDVRLDPEWNRSVLNLALKLHLSDSYIKNPDSATVTSFLNTFKVSEGNYSIKLNASIEQFNQSSILLLQKGP